jgi:plastocyanin
VPNRMYRVVLLAVTALVLLPAIAFAATYRVRADGHSWLPRERRIVRGDSIRWRNPTTRIHDITAWGGNWTYHRVLDPGEGVTRRFGTRGVYRYRCARHSGIVDGSCQGMCGIIRVRSSA